MRRVAAAACLTLGGLVLLAGPSGAQSEPGSPPVVTTPEGRPAPVDVLEVDGLLDPVLAEFITEALADASSGDAQALVLQLDSPGSVLSDDEARVLLERVQAAPVPVVVWVGPSGALAGGHAAALTVIADVSGMAPGTRIGDMGEPPVPLPPAEAAATAAIRAGWLDDGPAVAQGVVDLAAPTLGDLVVSLDGMVIDGRTLETAQVVDRDGQPRREPTAQVRFFAPSLLDQLMHTVASPPVAYLLLLAGMLLIMLEFYTAGVGVAGVTGALAFVLGCYGLAVLPTRPLGVALLVGSMLAFAVDVQAGVPRFWTAVGTLALLAGSFLLYDGLFVGWLALATALAGMLVMMLTGMPSVIRSRFGTPTIGRDAMVGEEGEAVGAVAPDGVVRVREATWPARTNRATPIAPGEAVRVVGIDGPVLEVEPRSGGARDYRERRSGR